MGENTVSSTVLGRYWRLGCTCKEEEVHRVAGRHSCWNPPRHEPARSSDYVTVARALCPSVSLSPSTSHLSCFLSFSGPSPLLWGSSKSCPPPPLYYTKQFSPSFCAPGSLLPLTVTSLVPVCGILSSPQSHGTAWPFNIERALKSNKKSPSQKKLLSGQNSLSDLFFLLCFCLLTY